MILDIDSGNSRLKWRLVKGNVTGSQGSFVHGKGDFDSLELLIREAIKVRLANVGPKEIVRLIENACDRFGVPLFIAQANKESHGVRNSYDCPAALGVDRWLAMIAGFESSTGACCVIDCGSAITFDVVASDGHHLGGYIVPGLQLLFKSLREDTKQIDFSRQQHSVGILPGNSTQTAVNHGVMSLISSWLNKLIADYRNSFDNEITFYITGGDGCLIMAYLEAQPIYVPDLVLQGLAIVDNED